MPADTILVSSAGRRGHLVQLLRSAVQADGGSIVAADVSPLAAAGMLADHFELVPRVTDPGFVDAVLDVCRRHAVTVLAPTIDPELPVYAAARERFRDAGCTVWVSAPEVVALGTDKWLFHQWLTARGLASPPTYEAGDPAAARLAGPVVAKPRRGSSSIGLVRAESVQSLDLAALPADYIVQGAVPGYEITVDFAVDGRGELLGIGARRRLEVRAGEVSKAVTVEHERLRALVEEFVAGLGGAFGVLNVQVIVDDDAGTITFLELNPRFGGGYPLTWQAGGTYPLSLLDQTGTARRRDATPGLYMLRYDAAVFAAERDLPRPVP